jgi:hypothetical protein
MKPRTTYDPKTSQYCCLVIIDTEDPAGAPWHMAYFDVDLAGNDIGMSIDVTEIVAPDGRCVSMSGLDMDWIEDQCRDGLI